MGILEPCYGYRESQLVKMAGIFPYFQAISSSDGPTVIVDGRRLVMLGSNNYLGPDPSPGGPARPRTRRSTATAPAAPARAF